MSAMILPKVMVDVELPISVSAVFPIGAETIGV